MPSLRSLNKKTASYLFSTLTLILALVGAAQPQASASSVTINLTTPPTLSGTPGSTITYTTNWSGGPTSTSWEIFTHFVDSSGNIVFQDPAHYPNPLTTSWKGGAYTETRTIGIPSTLPAGTYYVMAGMFNGGTRLTLNPGPGVTKDNQTRYKIATLTVDSDLTIVFTPLNPIVACTAAAGTLVSAVSVTGGDGNAVTLAMSGDTTDFALSGSNIVVAAGGITSSACGTFQTVIVAASQP